MATKRDTVRGLINVEQSYRVVQVEEATLNDSDKALAVPTGKQWRLMAVYAELISTVVVGNRQLDVHLRNTGGDILAKYQAGAVQTASLTREYVFAPLHPQEVAFTAGVMLRALGEGWVLPAAFDVRVFDSAAIDAAADDMTVRLLVEEQDQPE